RLLAVVVELGDVGVREPGRVAGLGAEPLDEPVVAGELLAQDLRGDIPGQGLVVRDPHLTHPADRDERAQDVPVAQAQPRVGPHRASTAWMTARAIGAATCPPVASAPRLPPCSTTTATATCGLSAGAKAVNQACGATVGSPVTVWAVPVLPATAMPGMAAA